MKIDYMAMLKEFHNKYNHHQSNKPCIPNELHIRMLRVKLIQEESQEFTNAAHDNIIEIADALADLLYVTFGTALTYGIPIDEVFTEVHRSNMTKSMEKDTKSIKGKTIKGPNWEPPKIGEILERYKR